jgi:ribonuclease BN (tRNA processing enzyme)
MSQVLLRLLGTGDAFGSGGRFQTCLHLAGPEGSLLLDCGASSLVAIKRAGLDPSAIGWVLLTHLHGDHFGGVPFLILDGHFGGRTAPLLLAGPPGVRERVEAALEVLFPGSSAIRWRFPLTYVELAEGVAHAVGPVRVTAFPVEHPSGAPAYALRVGYADRVLAYSGDTAWTERLVEVARGADLFVCEAYTFEQNVPYHVSYRTLQEHRGRLACRRLMVTHMGPEMLRRAPEADVECAADGQIISL